MVCAFDVSPYLLDGRQRSWVDLAAPPDGGWNAERPRMREGFCRLTVVIGMVSADASPRGIWGD